METEDAIDAAIVVVAHRLDERPHDAVAEHPGQEHLTRELAVATDQHQQAEQRQPDQRLVDLRRMDRERPGRVVREPDSG